MHSESFPLQEFWEDLKEDEKIFPGIPQSLCYERETGEEEIYNTKHEEEFFYIEGGRELEQAAQGRDGVSLSGGNKHPPGPVSLLPALDGPAFAGGLDWISPEVPSNSVILWYSRIRRTANLTIPKMS